MVPADARVNKITKHVKYALDDEKMAPTTKTVNNLIETRVNTSCTAGVRMERYLDIPNIEKTPVKTLDQMQAMQ